MAHNTLRPLAIISADLITTVRNQWENADLGNHNQSETETSEYDKALLSTSLSVYQKTLVCRSWEFSLRN